MDKAETLRRIIAQLTDVDPATVVDGFDLNHRSLQGSAGRARLDARVRRELGIKSPVVYSARTFAALESALFGTGELATAVAAPATSAAASPAGAPPLETPIAGLRCGIDMEPIARMPETRDYWEHEFYQQFFSPREIAYCVSQPEPRQHFAVRWCAKEALKKCDPSFLAVEFAHLEIVADETGRPILKAQRGGTWMRLPHAVSLSHAPPFAVAMVVSGAAAAPAPAAQNAPAAAPAPVPGNPAPAPKGLFGKLLGR